MSRPTFQFAYQVTREYPYSWFPWVTTIGGVLLCVLISTFSLASNGYYLRLVYTTDPNATIAAQDWFTRPPFSWIEHPVTTCQAAQLQVGANVITDKLWRQFKVEYLGVYTSPTKNTDVPAPILRYMNNPLEACRIPSIQLHLEPNTTFTSISEGLAFEIKAFVFCDVNTDPPSVIVLSSSFEDMAFRLKNPLTGTSNGPNVSAKPTLVAAELSSYVYAIVYDAEHEQRHELAPGIYTLNRDPKQNPPGDITSTKFWAGLRLSRNSNAVPGGPRFNFSAEKELALPAALDRTIKLFYSTLLTDFGELNTTVFAEKSLLWRWVTDIVPSPTSNSSFAAESAMWISEASPFLSAMQSMLNSTRDFAAPAPTLSTIYTQYQCQVPRLKATGTLIMAVFLADLVFLRAIWWAFRWTTVWWLRRSDPHAMCCECCAERGGRFGDEERGRWEDGGGGGVGEWFTRRINPMPQTGVSTVNMGGLKRVDTGLQRASL